MHGVGFCLKLYPILSDFIVKILGEAAMAALRVRVYGSYLIHIKI